MEANQNISQEQNSFLGELSRSLRNLNEFLPGIHNEPVLDDRDVGLFRIRDFDLANALIAYGVDNVSSIEKLSGVQVRVPTKVVVAGFEHDIPGSGLGIPVGEYGQEAAVKLMKSAYIYICQARSYFSKIQNGTLPELAEVLVQHSFSAGAGACFPVEGMDKTKSGYLRLIQEAIQSIMNSVALLTFNKVPGYDETKFVELAEACVETGTIDHLSRTMVMGELADFCQEGKSIIPRNLVTVKEGKIIMSDEWKTFDNWYKTYLARPPFRTETGRGCPVPADILKAMATHFVRILRSL